MKIILGESFAEQITLWGVPCSFCDLQLAPQLVRYNFQLVNILQFAKVKKLAESLAIWSGNETTIEKCWGGFSIIQPRNERENLTFYNCTETLNNAKPYSIVVGTDVDNNQITATLDDLTHLLVAGTTGSGKSVSLNNIICSLICYNRPEDLALILIDMKKVEFAPYKNISHLLTDIITTPETAESVLSWLINEMEMRYTALERLGKRKNDGEFKKIVCIIDELNDLVMTNENIKPLLVRLLQKARAVGIHFIVATQSPRAKILDGVMLANLPSRIALTCSNVRESMLILGHKGTEILTGKGDAIFKTPNSIIEKRVQIPLITDKQIEDILES